MRALISIRRGPLLVALSSTWNTPSLKPSSCNSAHTRRTNLSTHKAKHDAADHIAGRRRDPKLAFGALVEYLVRASLSLILSSGHHQAVTNLEALILVHPGTCAVQVQVVAIHSGLTA